MNRTRRTRARAITWTLPCVALLIATQSVPADDDLSADAKGAPTPVSATVEIKPPPGIDPDFVASLVAEVEKHGLTVTVVPQPESAALPSAGDTDLPDLGYFGEINSLDTPYNQMPAVTNILAAAFAAKYLQSLGLEFKLNEPIDRQALQAALQRTGLKFSDIESVSPTVQVTDSDCLLGDNDWSRCLTQPVEYPDWYTAALEAKPTPPPIFKLRNLPATKHQWRTE